MNSYEIAVLYHPDLEVDLSKAEAKVQKIVTDNTRQCMALVASHRSFNFA